MSKQNLSSVITIALVVVAMLLWAPLTACAEQKVEWIKVEPSSLYINTPTTVTITAKVATDLKLMPEGVNVVEVDIGGRPTTLISRLYDDGTHGDAAAGDNVFTVVLTYNEMQPRRIFLKVSVPYKGKLQRVLSDTVLVLATTNENADQVRTEVARHFREGNTASAKGRFIPSRNDDLLEDRDPAWLREMAEWIEGARLVKETPKYRVYHGSWIDRKGTAQSAEFRMVKDDVGAWKIDW